MAEETPEQEPIKLDPYIVAVVKAMRQVESGNKNIKGASGETGRFQYMPAVWKEWAGKYLGNENAEQTLENENEVAYKRVLYLADEKGYNVGQIASHWNSGNAEWKGNVGINAQGVEYNTPEHVKKVYEQYLKFAEEAGLTVGERK